MQLAVGYFFISGFTAISDRLVDVAPKDLIVDNEISKKIFANLPRHRASSICVVSSHRLCRWEETTKKDENLIKSKI